MSALPLLPASPPASPVFFTRPFVFHLLTSGDANFLFEDRENQNFRNLPAFDLSSPSERLKIKVGNVLMSATEDKLYQITHFNQERRYAEQICPGTNPDCIHGDEVCKFGGYLRMTIKVFRPSQEPYKRYLRIYHRLTGDEDEAFSQDIGNDMHLIM